MKNEAIIRCRECNEVIFWDAWENPDDKYLCKRCVPKDKEYEERTSNIYYSAIPASVQNKKHRTIERNPDVTLNCNEEELVTIYETAEYPVEAVVAYLDNYNSALSMVPIRVRRKLGVLFGLSLISAARSENINTALNSLDIVQKDYDFCVEVINAADKKFTFPDSSFTRYNTILRQLALLQERGQDNTRIIPYTNFYTQFFNHLLPMVRYIANDNLLKSMYQGYQYLTKMQSGFFYRELVSEITKQEQILGTVLQDVVNGTTYRHNCITAPVGEDI